MRSISFATSLSDGEHAASKRDSASQKLNDTLIAFVADHGEELHDHGQMGHGFAAYGEIANVVMMLHRPGYIPAGVRVEETTRSIDLMPTLLKLSGLPVPDGAQGQSVLPLIAAYQNASGDEALAAAIDLGWENRPAVTEEHKRDEDDEDDDESFAVVFEGWKLIHNTRTSAGLPSIGISRGHWRTARRLAMVGKGAA